MVSAVTGDDFPLPPSRNPVFDSAHCPRLVVKVGSSLLVEGEGEVRRAWLTTLVADLAARHRAGQQLIIVSSGAIALGARRLGFDKGGRASLADAQASASVGQIALSGLWAELLGSEGLTAAQMLLTLDDLEDRRRYLNATATIDRLLDAGAIPVINENDSVATEEIRFGDNDRLAARIGQAARAQGVILLSDVDGLYDRHPRDPAAVLIDRVDGVTPAIRAMADGTTGSGMGSGGMLSKLQAAEIAEMAGIRLAICQGQVDHPLARWAETGIGTVFHPRRQGNARKAWLGGRLRLKGSITVDAGAARALVDGSSLLPAGVTAVEGTFLRGDAIAILDLDGNRLGQGLAEYDALDCVRVMGRHSSELEALLGHAPRRAIVHRDQMVLL